MKKYYFYHQEICHLEKKMTLIGKSIFQIEQVKESDLIIDKSNFRKAGWIFFELYECLKSFLL